MPRLHHHYDDVAMNQLQLIHDCGGYGLTGRMDDVQYYTATLTDTSAPVSVAA
jgi:hypothetical protein